MSIKKEKQERLNKIECLEEIILELEGWLLGEKIKESTLIRVGKIDDEKQRDTIVNLLKDNISLMKSINPDVHKLYLTDIVKKRKNKV